MGAPRHRISKRLLNGRLDPPAEATYVVVQADSFVAPGDAAVGANNINDRPGPHQRADSVGVWPCQAKLLNKAASFVATANGEPKKYHSTLFIFFMDLHQIRHRFAAGRSQLVPDVDDDHLASQVAWLGWAAIQPPLSRHRREFVANRKCELAGRGDWQPVR